MGTLAALPGVRELRAPAVAGYLWLLFIVLLAGLDLDEPPPVEGVYGDLYELGKAIGPIGIAVAISVAAYLLGSASVQVTDYLLERAVELNSDASRRAFDRVRRLEEIGKKRIAQVGREDAGALRLELGRHDAQARSDLREELRLATGLLTEERELLFGRIDRARADAEFRAAIVGPIAALATLLAACSTPLWALVLAASLSLARQGYDRMIDSRRLTAEAIATGQVASPALQEYEQWIDTLPGIRGGG